MHDRRRTVGILDFNADRITWVNTKFEGWIEKVHVNYVGQDVRQGQALFEIYSPDLVTTQEEYLRALDYKTSLEGSDRPETQRQAESLVRPFARRRWRVALPARVRMRPRKPCLRLRRRLFG